MNLCCDDSCNTCSGNLTTNCLTCNYDNDGTFLNATDNTCGPCATHYFGSLINYTVSNKILCLKLIFSVLNVIFHV